MKTVIKVLMCIKGAVRRTFLTLSITTIVVPVLSQAIYPVIGKPVPEFTIRDMRFYSRKELTNRDVQGKWVILDFFSKGCSTCFESFPKVNELSKEFKDQVEIILVGDKRAEDIDLIYERFRKKQNLNLPVGFEEDLLVQWNIRRFPNIVWIANDGIVKAITTSTAFTRENIRTFLSGKSFQFDDFSNDAIEYEEESFHDGKPLLIDGNGGEDEDFLFRSLLGAWKPSVRQSILVSIESLFNIEKERGMFQVTGATLENLYEYALTGAEISVSSNYGKLYHMPILDVRDSSLFRYNYETGANIFNYSLIVPREVTTRERLMEIMQRDLKNYFNFEATIDTVEVPYWSLRVREVSKARLRNNRGGSSIISGDHSGYTLKNIPIQRLIRTISYYHQKEPPFIDNTGIDFNIDLNLRALMTDLSDIIQALDRQGIVIKRDKMKMPAIVIRGRYESHGN